MSAVSAVSGVLGLHQQPHATQQPGTLFLPRCSTFTCPPRLAFTSNPLHVPKRPQRRLRKAASQLRNVARHGYCAALNARLGLAPKDLLWPPLLINLAMPNNTSLCPAQAQPWAVQPMMQEPHLNLGAWAWPLWRPAPSLLPPIPTTTLYLFSPRRPGRHTTLVT